MDFKSPLSIASMSSCSRRPGMGTRSRWGSNSARSRTFTGSALPARCAARNRSASLPDSLLEGWRIDPTIEKIAKREAPPVQLIADCRTEPFADQTANKLKPEFNHRDHKDHKEGIRILCVLCALCG